MVKSKRVTKSKLKCKYKLSVHVGHRQPQCLEVSNQEGKPRRRQVSPSKSPSLLTNCHFNSSLTKAIQQDLVDDLRVNALEPALDSDINQTSMFKKKKLSVDKSSLINYYTNMRKPIIWTNMDKYTNKEQSEFLIDEAYCAVDSTFKDLVKGNKATTMHASQN